MVDPVLPAFQESCGDFSLRIGRDGSWFYHDSPIRRLPLVKLFASVLRREADGGYWLVTPAERGQILVEDVPFIAVAMEVTGSGRDSALTFRTNLDDTVTASVERPIRVVTDAETAEPSPYVLIRAGLEARINRSVFYDLVELGVEEPSPDGPQFGVWSCGAFFPLAT